MADLTLRLDILEPHDILAFAIVGKQRFVIVERDRNPNKFWLYRLGPEDRGRSSCLLGVMYPSFSQAFRFFENEIYKAANPRAGGNRGYGKK